MRDLRHGQRVRTGEQRGAQSEWRALWLAALLFLLALWRLLCPTPAQRLRAWAERGLAPGAEELLEAWGRGLAGEEKRIAVLAPPGRRGGGTREAARPGRPKEASPAWQTGEPLPEDPSELPPETQPDPPPETAPEDIARGDLPGEGSP